MANTTTTKKTGARTASKSNAAKTGARATSSKTSVKSSTATARTKNSRATEFAQEKCRLTDYDIASDVLGSHKTLIKLYGTALCEIASLDLRSLVTSQMTECAEDQYDAFLYMSDRGMYNTEPATIQKVKEARQRFCGCIKNLKK